MSIYLALLLVAIVGVYTEGYKIGIRPFKSSVLEPRSSLGIINGTTASIEKYPFIASLRVDGNIFGSAVILNKRWLLTTAFNVAWSSLSSLEFRVGSNKYDQGGQTLTAQKAIYHQNYTGSWNWDIAVVKTTKPIRFGKKVKAIDLGTTELKGGTKGVVLGWGEKDTSYSTSEVLLGANVTVLAWKTCYQTYTSDLTENLFCTYDKKVGPCVYDFGDPLVVDRYVYGLYAGGYGCTPGSYPQLYTDVAALASWVKQTIKSEGDDE